MRVRPLPLLALLTAWPVRSQQRARRNALVACTALTERRRELADVEEFLARRAAARAAAPTTLEVAVRDG
jgi:hypothetical protein